MTAAKALLQLRARGFNVRVEEQRLLVTGPPARDTEAVEAWLGEHWRELRDLVVYETHPTVRTALEVFPDARLASIRAPHRTWSPLPTRAFDADA
ncbi:MAG TPA: hypothetical protein VGJ84_11855 [Polyangiaceae bacterium]|jgi:hypothetical protein